MSTFAPAVKSQLKARVALTGPTGSGKTWTALEFAQVLAGDGKIALIDTERDSARLYANRFAFDVARFDPPYDVARLVAMLREAESAGYGCVVVDSLTHFWEGEGGVLDEVDAAAARSGGGNTFAGWKHGTPLQRHMVDTFLALGTHVVVTMRSKMEYVLEDNDRGKKVPRKVGLAPVQRAGLEYEFTIVGDLDLEHRLTISKSRCDVLADKVIQPDRADEAAKTFLNWLDDGTPPPPPLGSKEEHDDLTARVDKVPPEIRDVFAAWKTAQNFEWHPGYSREALRIMDRQLDVLLEEHGQRSEGSAESATREGAVGEVGRRGSSDDDGNATADPSYASADPDEPTGYALWSNDELIAEIKKRNEEQPDRPQMPHSGNKERLVAELRAFDAVYGCPMEGGVEHASPPF